jgi:hypothetical protein
MDCFVAGAPRNDDPKVLDEIGAALKGGCEGERRHCERSEAIHSTAQRDMDCFVALLLAMTTEGPYSSTIRNCLYFDGLRRQARQ